MMKSLLSLFLLAFALNLNATFAQDNQSAQTTTDELPRYEVGVQFTSLNRESSWAGFGGRFTYNFNRYVAAEAEGNVFPGRSFDGRSVQGLFGVKVGKRWSKVGVFGKVRPGFIYASEGRRGFFANPDNSIRVLTDGTTNFALDTGGVVEIYPSKKIFLRLDAGALTVRRGGYVQNFVVQNPQTGNLENQSFNIPSFTNTRFQFSAGVGFRF